MQDWILNNFLWIKAFHIVAVVCWFAALFYLPRLFVYHAMSEDKISKERFKVMERKLYRGIATPSMIATIALGALSAANNLPAYLSLPWFHVKMAMVLLLVAYHFCCFYFLKQFQRDRCDLKHVFFRWFNEAPVFLLIGIVIMVVVRPI